MAKSVLITGAAGGIGHALCEEFSREGYKVIATDLADSSLPVCDTFIECDLGKICHSSAALGKLTKAVRNALKGNVLSVLINNAAVQILGSTKSIKIHDWRSTLDINLTAPLILTQVFLDDLVSCCGNVINVASVHAKATKPKFVSYATSKAALVGLTQSLAVDLGGRVRVNAINPAATSTLMLRAGFEGNPEAYKELNEMHPIGRIAEVHEIAKVAAFLASEKASFITGEAIDVDGGVLVRLHDPE